MKSGELGGRDRHGVSRRRLIAGSAVMLAAGARSAWVEDPFATLKLFLPRRHATAPDFTVAGLGVPPVRLRDFAGQVILLNFWATWCPPCREEMPSLERLYRRFQSRMFTVVALSIDGRGEEVVRPFVKRFGLTFPVGLDSKMSVAGEYRVAGLPTSILIGESAGITAIAVGPRDWDSPAAHQVIEKMLASRKAHARAR